VHGESAHTCPIGELRAQLLQALSVARLGWSAAVSTVGPVPRRLAGRCLVAPGRHGAGRLIDGALTATLDGRPAACSVVFRRRAGSAVAREPHRDAETAVVRAPAFLGAPFID